MLMGLKSYNKKLFFALIFTLIIFNGFSQTIVINEVVYSNKGCLQDSFGNTPDWIELYNAANYAINLEAYIIADGLETDDYWNMPAYSLQPGEYKVIFASGKNIRTGNEWHTDFKLGLMQEQVFLLNPQQIVIDFIPLQCVPPDKSLSCKPDGDSQNRKVCIPSPGQSNNEADEVIINYLPDELSVSHSSGFFNGEIEVELTNLNPENKICFTLNANDPDYDDDVYTEALILDDRTPYNNRFADEPPMSFKVGNDIFKAQVLRAQVYSEGCPAGNPINRTFFISNTSTNPYNVPVVSLITDKDNLFDDDEGIYVLGNNENYWRSGKAWERDVYVEMFDKSGVKIIDQMAGMRIHGGGNRKSDQKSLRLYARNKFGKGWFSYPFFEDKQHIDSCKRLILRNVKDWDGTMIVDELSQNLVKDMNIDYSAFVTSIVFINGEYWGIYSLRERQDEYYVGSNYFIETPNITIIESTPERLYANEGSMNEYNELITTLELANKNSESFYSDIDKLIDLDALIDYYCAEIYLANIDFPYRNMSLWKTDSDTSRWRYFFYDCDACMDRFTDNLLREYGSGFEEFYNFHDMYKTILSHLLQNNEFKQKFQSKMYYHLNTTFNPERVLSEIENLEDVYNPLVNEHIYRWHIPSDYVRWKQNIDRLKLFAMKRPMIVKEFMLEYFGLPFNIYPNPATNSFNINLLSDTENLNISITDLYGRTVYEKSYSNQGSLISINPELPQGMYLINVCINDMIFTKKIVML
ncbi:MAG TPA: CotH kinase family protein [Bacteroidales bacterium]|nr:CotH kinase family protein [Bacteroidales bacterium]